MSDYGKRPVPSWYWIAAVLALLWNAFGCFQYITQVSMTADDLAKLTQAQQDLMAWQPPWLNGVFAVAVWSGLAGCVGLLMRKRWAVFLLALSVVAVAVMFGYILIASNAIRDMGFAGAAGFPIFIFVAALIIWWFARSSRAKGWLS